MLFQHLHQLAEPIQEPAVLFFSLGCYVDFLNRPNYLRNSIIQEARDQQFPLYLQEFIGQHPTVPIYIFLVDPSFSCFRDPRDPLVIREDGGWEKTVDSGTGVRVYKKENVQIHVIPLAAGPLESDDFTKIFHCGDVILKNSGAFVILDQTYPSLFNDRSSINGYTSQFENFQTARQRFQYDCPISGSERPEKISSIYIDED